MLTETTSVEKLINNYAQDEAERMTAAVRQRAVTTGWDKDLASSLSVSYVNGSLQLQYPDEMKEKVLDAEYGTGPVAPTSVIRGFGYRSAHMENILNADVIDEMIMTSGIFNG